MNLLVLKQISLLSIFAGALLGVVTLIPYLSFFSFIILFLLALFVIIYLKQNDLIGLLSLKEGCSVGGIVGFISFIAFSIIYAPASMIIGWLEPSYTQGFLRFFLGSFGSIIVMIFLIIFMAGISALFNAFFGLLTVYIYELITGVKKDHNENNSVDFEIK